MAPIKILIIKIGAIGDVVMAMPMLRALRETYPEAQIDWLCGTLVAPLLEATSLVSHLYTLDEQGLFHGSKVRQVLSAWQQQGSYDLILVGNSDPRYRYLIRPFSRAEVRTFQPRPGHYHAEEYLELAGCGGEVRFPELRLPEVGVPAGRPLIVVAPGGAVNPGATQALKRWPIEHYRTLIEQLKGTVVVTGSASDAWVRETLTPGSYIDSIGKLSLLEMVALLKRADRLVTHDSGPLHLGKLARCATVALFGPTPPSSFVGKGEAIQVLTASRDCSPCYNGKRFAACSSNECLRALVPERVLQEIERCQ